MPEGSSSQFDNAEYSKLLSEMFPSEYSRKRAAFIALQKAATRSETNSPLHKKAKTSSDDSTSDSESSYSSESASDTEENENSSSGSEESEHRITLIVKNRRDETDTESDTGDDDLKDEDQKAIQDFRRLLKGKSAEDELQYFKTSLTAAERKTAVAELSRISKLALPSKPYALQLLDTDLPDEYKAIAYRKVAALRELEPGSGEFHKLKQWVTTLMQIPFGKYKDLPVSLEKNTVDECSEFFGNAKKIMDEAVYGLDEVKEQIYQLLGQWISNPSAMGTAIAIEGPMGTGKTTIVKEGISRALGRDFVFVALGGATDSSFLEGHSYTYEGAMHGRIVDGLTKCKSMNPVFFFDELDKVSDSARGQEIIGILTHLTDLSQNKEFHDKYFSEITFDLSRSLFVFSYNDARLVNPILKDRMHKLTTRGYSSPEKINISRGYLIPACTQLVNFDDNNVIINDDVIKYIAEKFTKGEKGVRNLQRCLAAIFTKLNLLRMVKQPNDYMKSNCLDQVKLPIKLSSAHIDKLLGAKSEVEGWRFMYM